MNKFEDFIKSVAKSLKNLPGLDAQLKSAPITRLEEFKSPTHINPARKSAVLIIFYPDKDKIKTLLMERAADNTVHSKQISFPGGKYEKEDISLEYTAKREAWEEVGIQPEEVNIIGPLSKLYIPPSNFDVYPFVAYSNTKPEFSTNHEVKSLIEVDIEILLDPKTFTKKPIELKSGKEVMVPNYFINGHIIWGATSMIICELLAVINNSRT